jgi:TonB family protein
MAHLQVMRRTLVSVFALVFVDAAVARAQAPEVTIMPVRWPVPIYPQIAQSARVTGDVEVAIDVGPDGRVAAAKAVNGPPLLVQAAEDAARQATFECRGCVEPVSRYSLYVSFRLGEVVRQAVVVSPTQGWVTVSAPSPMIGGGPGVIPRVRATKCLFLWRCGWPASRARLGRCLWLWPCGDRYEWL